MPRTDDPYSRVYWRLVDDPKFQDVYADDRAFATWVRLLMTADQAWPASATLPAGVSKVGLKKCVDAGLVDASGMRFRIHGLDAERARRSRQGKAGADARWNRDDEQMPSEEGPSAGAPVTRPHPAARPPGTPHAYDDGMPTHPVPNAGQEETRKEETRKEETRKARALPDRKTNGVKLPDGFDEEPEGPAMTWLDQHGCYIAPNDKRLLILIRAVEKHGVGTIVAIFERLAALGMENGDTSGFVFGAVDSLRNRPRLGAKDAVAAVEHDVQRVIRERLNGRGNRLE